MGNLPTNVSVNRVKAYFVNAARIDIGFAQRMKYTRYAFIRYNTVEEAFEGFRMAFKMELGPRSLVIRFRRTRGYIGLNSNDPDGKKTSKRARKAMLDEEAIAAQEITPNLAAECDMNSFADDRKADTPCSLDSHYLNDSQNSHDDDFLTISLNNEKVLSKTIKEESIMDENLSMLSNVGGSQSKLLPVINTAIKKEFADEFSDDEYFDGIFV